MTSDRELLAHYAATNSEEAFAELVRRYVNLVYSAALRQVNGDTHLAQDVAQTVFTDLSRHAGSLARRETLTGWLYTSAHFTAAKILRGENRRRAREEQFMREPIADEAGEADWGKIRPVLDAAMHHLKDADREAILLRYFENRPFAEVGAKLGLNENAARMRVERALEKLRASLVKRGIQTAAPLASILAANAVQMAPTGLAATLTTTSIATGGAGAFTLLKIMTATKLKLGISAILVAGVATALVVQHQNRLTRENQSLRQQISQLAGENESYSNRLASNAGVSQRLPDDQLNELLKLRGEVAVLRQRATDAGKVGGEINEANQKASEAEGKLAALQSAREQFATYQNNAINAAKEIGLAARIYSGDNGGQFPTNLLQLGSELVPQTNNNTWTLHGVDLWSFDFMNIGQVTQDHPNMVMLRERLPRQAPDGTWTRLYGLADGSVQTATSYDGNFDAWEKVNTYTPPANQ
jgi:RNA polymerase sigma factor (sigma-70 family)